jgi:RNA polymerase sigma-70 factor, ECF subfamily
MRLNASERSWHLVSLSWRLGVIPGGLVASAYRSGERPMPTRNFRRRRRVGVRPSDDKGVSQPAPAEGMALVEIYDRALGEVYGYLLHRCGSRLTAQDLTSETFVAAARALRDGASDLVTVPWLIGVARHKLVDHWRRRAREERALSNVDGGSDREEVWDRHLDEFDALETLRQLGVHHRAALTLRYVDDLPVREVAALLGRSEAATVALLVRARQAFRRSYEHRGGDDAV